MIYKPTTKEYFTIIPNDILKDSSLSIGARMFYALAQSFNEEWQINLKHFAELLNVSEASAKKYRTELVNAGLLCFQQMTDALGRFTGEIIYTFTHYEHVETQIAAHATQSTGTESAHCHTEQREVSNCHAENNLCHAERFNCHTERGARSISSSSEVSNISQDTTNNPLDKKADNGFFDNVNNIKYINNINPLDVCAHAREQNAQSQSQDSKTEPQSQIESNLFTSQESGNTESATLCHTEGNARSIYTSSEVSTQSAQKTTKEIKENHENALLLKVLQSFKSFTETTKQKPKIYTQDLSEGSFTQAEIESFKDFIKYRKERGFLAKSTIDSITRDFKKLKAQKADIRQCVDLCINRGWSGLLKANESLNREKSYRSNFNYTANKPRERLIDKVQIDSQGNFYIPKEARV